MEQRTVAERTAAVVFGILAMATLLVLMMLTLVVVGCGPTEHYECPDGRTVDKHEICVPQQNNPTESKALIKPSKTDEPTLIQSVQPDDAPEQEEQPEPIEPNGNEQPNHEPPGYE